MVGLRPILAHGRNARLIPLKSRLVALRRMRVPSAPGFRLDVGETGSRRRIGDADQMLAGWALNLPPGELWFATQRLIAVGTIKLEFVRAHSLLHHHAQTGCKKYMKDLFILFVRRMRM
jgi:hypothetical protein